jgi:hypothetical protein
VTQRVDNPEGRGATTRRRSKRPQMILTSSLEVFGGPEQARILHVPQAGVPTGTGGTYVKRYIPKKSFCPFLCIPKDVQEGGFGIPCLRLSKGSNLRRGCLLRKDLWIRMITYSSPFRRRETKEGRSSFGFPSIMQNIRGCFAMGRRIPGPIRSP